MYHLQQMVGSARWIRLAAWLLAMFAGNLGRAIAGQPIGPTPAQAGSFVCRADFSLADYQGLLAELTRLQTDLTRVLGIPAGRRADRGLSASTTRRPTPAIFSRYLPGVPYRRALYVKGRGPGRVFAYRGDQFEIDLRHECTHALLHAGLPRSAALARRGPGRLLPASRQAKRAYDNPHLDTLRQDARRGAVPSLEALEKLSGLADMRLAEYRGSWAWVHFMLHGPTAAHDELRAYLAGLSGQSPSSPPPALLNSRLRQRMPDVQQRFLDHFRTWRR